MSRRGPHPDAIAYDLIDAAEMCGVSKEILYRAVKSGDLRAKRTARTEGDVPRGKILVRRTELEEWFESLPDDWWGFKL